MFHHRHIGGVEHAFEAVSVIEALGQPQNVEVTVRCGAHNELGTLPGGGKLGSVALFDQLFLTLPAPHLDLTHRGQNGLLCFIRSQGPQACL